MERWRKLETGPFFRLSRLDCALARTRGGLCCREQGDSFLALPYAPDAPFPLEELFCFAEVRRIADKDYVVYRLNEKKEPIFGKN